MANIRIRWALAVFTVLAVIIVPFIIFENKLLAMVPGLERMADDPVLLAMLIFTVLALDVFLPVPSSLVMLLAGMALGPALGVVTTWAGLTAGCLLGYAAGLWAGTPLFRWWIGSDGLQVASRRFQNFGTIPLIFARPIPVLAEASTLVAGVTGYPFRSFCLLVALLNAVIAGVYSGLAIIVPEAHLLLFATLGLGWLAIIFLAAGRIIKRREQPIRER